MLRRTLLKILGASVVSPAATPRMAQAKDRPHRTSSQDHDRIQEIPSLCDLCFWRCGILAKVRDDQLLRIQGNPDHPRSKGRLCARGNAGLHLVEDPDRLKYPLLRTGERGEGQWKRISWNQALDLWSSKMKQTIKNQGPESIGIFSHGLSSRFINSLMLHLGNPNRTAPSFGQCRGPRDVGFQLTFGEGPGSPARHDMAQSKMIVLIGSHIGENVQTGQVAEFAEAISRGARLVVVDPRMSVAAGKADRWLQIRPGTDTALLLAWIHVLLADELFDRDYINRYATGLEELRQAVAGCTPAWAAEITQLPPEVIAAEAREMARLKPAVMIHCGRFSAWYGNDTQRSRAMAILVALLGAWGRPGGYYLPSRVKLGPPSCPPPHEGMARSVATGGHAFTRFGVAAQELVEASIGPDARIKQWILYGVNPLQSLPDVKRTQQAMNSVDFITMVDIIPTEGALWADLILPEASYLERYDDILMVKDHPIPFVALRQPAVSPRFEAKDPYWIAQQLAHRLGHKDCFTEPDVTRYLDARLAPLGITCAELGKKGIYMLDEQQPFLGPGQAHPFKTPSGKIELFSKIMSENGYHSIPTFEPVAQPPSGWFRLIAGRSPYHSFARTQNLKRLMNKDPENVLWINDGVARAKGLSTEERVYLENQDGVRVGPIRVLATPAIRTDVLYTVHGYGSCSPALRHAHAKGISDNLLASRFETDQPTGSTGFRVNFVQLVTEEGRKIPGETEACNLQRAAFHGFPADNESTEQTNPFLREKRAPASEQTPPSGKTPPSEQTPPSGKTPPSEQTDDLFEVQVEDSC